MNEQQESRIGVCILISQPLLLLLDILLKFEHWWGDRKEWGYKKISLLYHRNTSVTSIAKPGVNECTGYLVGLNNYRKISKSTLPWGGKGR